MSGDAARTVVTDMTVSFCDPKNGLSACALDPLVWHRVEKDLYLHTAQQTAWLHLKLKKEKDLARNDLVITSIETDKPVTRSILSSRWAVRPGGIGLRRTKYVGNNHELVTNVDVLFGSDAVDPRPEWVLLTKPLKLNARPEVPVARLSVLYGREKPRSIPRILKIKEDGKFKILQISDTHMVTGVGVCKDAIDAHGQLLPESEADPITINFLETILDIEQPDLVILTGDQLHHGALDAQSALLKLVAPFIKRWIPFAVVFGNHDDEGPYTLSRVAQMSILKDLPFSMCQHGPANLDGVGNYTLEVLAPEHTGLPVLTLYLLDTHGEIPSTIKSPDYDWIKQSQIDWFTSTSQALGTNYMISTDQGSFQHLSLAFMHIPLPEYAERDLVITGGHRGEPTECSSFNSRFFDVLARKGVVAVGCGHDHVNDFCGLLPQRPQEPHKESQFDRKTPKLQRPWLCYAGGAGFGGYGSYGGKHYHRRTRLWEVDTGSGDLRTWKRVEYNADRVDETVLVKDGYVHDPRLEGRVAELLQLRAPT